VSAYVCACKPVFVPQSFCFGSFKDQFVWWLNSALNSASPSRQAAERLILSKSHDSVRDRLSVEWGMCVDFFSEVCAKAQTKALCGSTKFQRVPLVSLACSHAEGYSDKCTLEWLTVATQITGRMSGSQWWFWTCHMKLNFLKTLVTGTWSGTSVHQGTAW
jgi:hypothetical protein